MQCGTFPSQHKSVTAEVLARLIQGETLTSMSMVFGAHTTRLAPKIHVLRHLNGWDIMSTPATIHTVDGRLTKVSEYRLSAASIQAALAKGGAHFCESVRVARDRLRRALQ
ncbi:MAG: hypothetical protein JWP47_362 [Polaromonas sp.]|nr:hypothetical protein [Polaromonas sp.]